MAYMNLVRFAHDWSNGVMEWWNLSILAHPGATASIYEYRKGESKVGANIGNLHKAGLGQGFGIVDRAFRDQSA